MVESGYDAERIAGLIGNYIKLKKRLSGIPIGTLATLSEYREMLQIQRGLERVTLTGTEILNLGDFVEEIADNYYIINSEAYKSLEEENRQLEERNEKLKEKLGVITSSLRTAAIEPFKGLLDIIEEWDKSSRIP